jgi:WS/DGAT/MGAT family acyltransferase
MDASFLRVESPAAHMHVGWLSTVDRPSGAPRLTADALRERVAGRLHLAPRFRQRVVPVALGVTEPVWRDDPAFALEDHVREAPDDREVDSRDLQRLAEAFFSVPLDRDRPLWEILVVPRMVRGRAAVLGKVHHAMVDGVAAVELGILLFDLAPDAAPPQAQDWRPEPPPGPARLAVDSLADTALEQFRAARRLAGMGRSPGRSIRIADTMRRAALSLADDALHPAPPSYLNVEIGPRRTLATHAVDLERLLAVKRAHGVSLNDVVLALCAGALRRFAEDRGDTPSDLRVMVPVSVRGDEGGTGNRITFAFIELPIGAETPRGRLARVVAQTSELKSSGRIAGSSMLLQGLGALPEPLKDRAARLAASPRLYNLTVSNVPGPRMPLYAAGGRVRSIFPVIPIPDRHALAIGVLTYDGRAHFALYADPEALPGTGRLAALLEEALAEMEVVKAELAVA